MSSTSTILSTSIPDSEQEQHKKGTKGFRKALLDGGGLVYLLRNIYYLLVSLVFYFIKPLALLLRFVPMWCYPKLPYPIEEEIVSTTTWVIFTRRKQNKRPIALKLWQFENICNTKLVARNIDYLLEGFEFNRRFAPEVYLGVAPVEPSKNPKKIVRRKLITQPDKSKLKQGVEYALVMRRLEDAYRLDQQIYKHEFGKKADIEFLAREIALMHLQLDKSPDDMGTCDRISSKLKINIELFNEALSKCAVGEEHIEQYRWMSNFMEQACKSCTRYFQQRYKENHVKHCHGDLKTTNLWILPEKSNFGLLKRLQQLIALDCVDFNPDFCHIDTLSDIAMLAIDLEMHLSDWSAHCINTYRGQKLAKHFLLSYLLAVQENSEAIWPLLEYYMTEKAMVCAYVSILYDKLPEQGEKYLDIALVHAQRLQEMLESTKTEDSSTLIPTTIVVG